MAQLSPKYVHSFVRPAVAGLALIGLLTACSEVGAAGEGQDHDDAGPLSFDDPLPEEVPEGTELVIGDPATQRALELSGEIDELSFDVEWANFSGGPRTSEAFRAGALDAGAVAEIPALHAYWTDLPTRTITASRKVDHLEHPVYEIGIAPGVADEVETLEDLEGLRIAYSPGQAQGALVLRVLDDVGLTTDDVELVELASTDDTYPNALSSNQVDAAPLGIQSAIRYADQYGEDGAITLEHGLRDDRGGIYVHAESLEDPAKAAALVEYAHYWGRARAWIDAHPEIWAEQWYVEHQGLTPEQAEELLELEGDREVPSSWEEIIAQDQETADILLQEQDRAEPIDVENEIFDLRFESIAGEAWEEARDEYADQ
ncbi:ABC transporter substrate-binding protein [Nesterenkonia alba]|uniref:ABC transporter substrate-binding protein n=1 Tax=Nesterenkonia alba TaxID=515814 RepID=UPI000686FD37|nr:ABC transporter substrate-binding protein [Nesterenkonia alba]